MVKLAIYVLFLHFLGDFICQSDWMALNKSKDWHALGVHVLVYTTVLWLGMFKFEQAQGFAFLNGIIHFGVDAVTSRITSRLYKANQTHWFFVVIGFDQFIHSAVLLGTLTCLR